MSSAEKSRCETDGLVEAEVTGLGFWVRVPRVRIDPLKEAIDQILSVHVGMMDGLKERDLTSAAIATHFIGGLSAGVFGHALFLLLG
jgi:hypothetical protein